MFYAPQPWFGVMIEIDLYNGISTSHDTHNETTDGSDARTPTATMD